jgi:serine/threonine-protein kinase
MATSSSDRDPVERLAEEFAERYRRGERPALSEYTARYPELAEQIRDLFPALLEMEQVGTVDAASGQRSPPAGFELGAPPRQLGEYRLLREIGRGGMGVVYEAVQEPLGRHVALKVLPLHGLLNPTQLERFRREAKAAARLHHTNIVPVFGVGEDNGIHYYAMQFIQGQGLDKILDDVRRLRGHTGKSQPVPEAPAPTLSEFVAQGLLSGQFPGSGPDPASAPTLLPGGNAPTAPAAAETPERPQMTSLPEAQYFRSVAQAGLQVAEALAYAHKQGVLHRDVKPSNLLLDTRGTVWITDFGLAKADDSDDLTNTGDLIGTLRYMSPERLEGNCDVRSEVYGVGVTLYEMVTLRPAFTAGDRMALLDQLRFGVALRPSRCDAHVPRDLETIILKAMARDPAERYATADELAADLQRFLADEPIRARRTSWRERGWRWCRRNPAIAGLAAALVLLLVGATGASVLAAAYFDRLARKETQTAAGERAARQQAEEAQQRLALSLKETEAQRRRAEQNFAKARAAVDDSFTRTSESQLLRVPGMQSLRRELLQSALAFYLDFLRERHDDPGVRAGLASAWLRVGKIREELGDAAEAAKARTEALTLYTQLAEASPKDVELLHGRAECLAGLGRYAEAIDVWKQLVNPGEPRFQRELADAYNNLGLAHRSRQDRAQALGAFQESLTIRERLVRLNPDDPTARYGLGRVLNNIGVLLGDRRHDRDALAMYRRAVEQLEIAFTRLPQVIRHGETLVIGLSNCAHMEHRLGNPAEALQWQRRAVDVCKRLSRDNPAIPRLHSTLVQQYRTLAQWQREANQSEEAERTLRLAREVIGRLPTESPHDLFVLACVRADCAAFIGQGKEKLTPQQETERQQEFALAMEALQKAIAAGFRDPDQLQTAAELAPLRQRKDFQSLAARLEPTAKPEHPADEELAPSEQNLKARQEALARQQKLAEADRANRGVQADLAASYHAVGLIQTELGRFDEAAKSLDQAVAVREALVKADPQNTTYREELGASYLARCDLYGKAAQAAKEAQPRRELWQKAEADCTRAAALLPNAPQVLLAHSRVLTGLGQFERAAAELSRVLELNPNDPQVWKERGRMYALQGQVEKAAADFARALALVPNQGAPWRADRAGIDDELVQWDEVFTRVVQARPEDGRLWIARARYHAHRGQWQQLVDDLSPALTLNRGAPSGWLASGLMRLQFGDVEGYRRVCRQMLDRFGQTSAAVPAYCTALACLLQPEAVPDLKPVLELAEYAVTDTEGRPLYRFYLLTRALADYREGQYARVGERLKTCPPRPDGDVADAWAFLCLSLAHHRLDQATEARQELARARALIERSWPRFDRGEQFPSNTWQEWLVCQFLRREAEALIEGKKIKTAK